tara:strand:+ start:3614 stop:4246 length:633 start_codon:yes stop_codon:yes gene_type:complete
MNTLILLRHGQSQWNLENRFTGWKNVDLTQKGVEEAMLAGKLMKEKNIKIDLVFSSDLKRANETAKLAISQMNLKNLYDKDKNLIMVKDRSLNERDYGDLVGLNKDETAEKYGKEQVHIWRRSFEIPPPGGESLKNVLERVKPYFRQNIKNEIENEKNVLIVAHGNSLRAIMIAINLYKPEQISKIELPTGNPFVITYKDKKIVEHKFLI